MANTTVTQDEKVLGAISYLWVLSVIILFVKKDSAFVQFHAKQGFILFLVSVVLWLIPILGWFLNTVLFIFVAIGIIQALNGVEWRMPLVATYADKIKF